MNTGLPVIFLLFTLLFLLSACEKPPDETQIREQITFAVTAIEKKQPRKAESILSDEFIANDLIDKQQLRQIFLAQTLLHERISIAIPYLSIEIDNEYTGIATMSASIVVTGATRLLPNDGPLYQVKGEWQKEEGEWRLISLNWE